MYNQKLIEKLNSYRLLDFDWDSYGAFPVNPLIIDSALKFIEGFGEELHVTCITPSSGGSIAFEWWNKSRILEIEWQSPDKIHLFQHYENNSCAELFFRNDQIYEIKQYVKWVRLND